IRTAFFRGMSSEAFVGHVGTYSPYLKEPCSWRQLSPANPLFSVRAIRVGVREFCMHALLKDASIPSFV
ncbi:MAG: hypothetical protein OEW62_10500, partial [Candidatus Bathyarchaeota archaeon]|nr:hypothetical protein [Candidatus Bathyarchaeota archaeon]